MKSIHYPRARVEMLREQQTERVVLLSHGIAAEAIDELHHADLDNLKGERNFHRHNYSLEEYGFLGDELNTSCGNLPPMSLLENVGSFMEQIESEQLFLALKALKPEELSLVEAIAIKGIRISEYARDMGVTKQTINARLKKILKNLQKVAV